MGEMESGNSFPELEVKPRLSPTRFVKVFMHGKPFGRKINLAAHKNYSSLSFTLKRLGNNYSMPPFQLNGLVNNEEDGALYDNDFDLLYDDVDGVRFFLGEVPWEIFIISVKKIYIVPVEQENEYDDYQEEDGDNAAAAGDDGDGAAADEGVAAAAHGVEHAYTYNSSFN